MMSSPLPPLYSRWIEEALGAEVPAEGRAVCSRCVQAAPEIPGGDRFDPQIKCCSYSPHLPNFLVGMLLTDRDERTSWAREQATRLVRERRGATPLGLSPPRRISDSYRAEQAKHFGRDPSLRCPYLDDQAGCGLWRFRNATCATWFCRHRRAAVGARFWFALGNELRALEQILAGWCLLRLEPNIEELFHSGRDMRRLSGGELRGWIEPSDGTVDADFAKRLWGKWHGRESEFFAACAELVRSLSWEDVKRIDVVRLELAERRLRAAFAAHMDEALPPVLLNGLVELIPLADGGAQVKSTELGWEALQLPQTVVDALERADGRPASQIGLDDAWLRKLVDYGVLVAPDGRDRPRSLGPQRPVDRRDRLRFFRGYLGLPVELSYISTSGSAQALVLNCGSNEVIFDDLELIEFGKRLHGARNGFYAEDALGWAPPQVTYTWERVAGLLQSLLDASVLQRIP
ncbi:MAG: hypothetical protein HY901_38155 [Deltaproteobacteria bacterium]|nr:hypothetical protein [Deltaproteobacteria bacterium]